MGPILDLPCCQFGINVGWSICCSQLLQAQPSKKPLSDLISEEWEGGEEANLLTLQETPVFFSFLTAS